MLKRDEKLFWIGVVSLVMAIAAHAYLINHHYGFKFGTLQEGGLCQVNSKINCDATTASHFSEVFGIPIAIFGALVNFVLLGLLLAFRYPLVKVSTQQALGTTLKILSAAIFFVSLIMGSISFFVIDAICPVCFITYALSLAAVVSIWLYTPSSLVFSIFEFKLWGGLALFVFSVAFFMNHNLKKSYGDPKFDEYTQLQFEDWVARSSKTIEPVSPVSVNPDPQAKMVMVEFADFLCGHCAQAYPILHKFLKMHPDVAFHFQAFPLDGACNPAINQSFGVSCLLAQAAWCADKQGQAWKTQEWIFENQGSLRTKEAVFEKLQAASASLSLDFDGLKQCIEGDESIQAIRAQAQKGIDVGVDGTPALYINGKKVPGGFSIPLLEKIYRKLN